MKKTILSVAKYLIFLIIGIGLFWLAIKGENIHEIVAYFKKANYWWIAFSLLIMLASHLLRALRWNLLLDTLHYKSDTLTTFYSVMIGYFVNLAVPRLGEVTRCGLLAKHHKLPLHAVLGTVIAERAFDIITLAVIILITILAQLQFLGDFLNKNVIAPFLIKFSFGYMMLFSIIGIAILVLFAVIYIYYIFKKVVDEDTIAHKVKQLLKGFVKGVFSIKDIRNKKLFLAYTAIIWFFYFIAIYICFFALDETSGLSLIDALTILALGSIGVIAPTPGGMGAYQYVVKFTLVSLFFIHDVPATAFANILYFAQWFMIIFVGGISWVLLIFLERKAHNYENK